MKPQKIGMMALATALIAGNSANVQIGHTMVYHMRNHWRTISGNRASGAATAKRAKRKARNIKSHSRAARGH